MAKVLVQFDGSNFYNKVKRLSSDIHLTNYDYAGLATSIVGKNPNQIIYYVGFENFISRALSKNCSSYLILKKNQILRFSKDKTSV